VVALQKRCDGGRFRRRRLCAGAARMERLLGGSTGQRWSAARFSLPLLVATLAIYSGRPPLSFCRDES
jgi:hypothetical protein